MRESLYSVSLGSPPRIAMLTAGYKGLFSRFFINKVNVVVVHSVSKICAMVYVVVCKKEEHERQSAADPFVQTKYVCKELSTKICRVS